MKSKKLIGLWILAPVVMLLLPGIQCKGFAQSPESTPFEGKAFWNNPGGYAALWGAYFDDSDHSLRGGGGMAVGAAWEYAEWGGRFGGYGGGGGDGGALLGIEGRLYPLGRGLFGKFRFSPYGFGNGNIDFAAIFAGSHQNESIWAVGGAGFEVGLSDRNEDYTAFAECGYAASTELEKDPVTRQHAGARGLACEFGLRWHLYR